jgi:hypothetical protein
MKFRMYSIAALAVLAMTLPLTAWAVVGTLDQESPYPTGREGGSAVIGTLPQFGQSYDIGQTFTVGITGQLSGVDFWILRGGTPTAPITLEIVRTDGSGAPSTAPGDVLGSATAPPPLSTGYVSWDLTPANISVTAGDELALVLSSTQDFNGSDRYDGLMGPISGPELYPPGDAWLHHPTTTPWEKWTPPGYGPIDFVFRTYVLSANTAPDCSGATASTTTLSPPNHKLRTVAVTGVTDPDGDAVSIVIVSIRQDEPTNGAADGDTSPDGVAGPGNNVQVRAERSGKGDGRVYYIEFVASDGAGGTCAGTVQVSVPQSNSRPAVGGGPLYDSTQ